MATQITTPVVPRPPIGKALTLKSKAFVRRFVVRVLRRLYEMALHVAEQALPPFANQPKQLRIELPRRLWGAEYMHIGDDVTIGPGSLLVAQFEYPSPVMQHPDHPVPVQRFKPKLIIGNRVTATGQLTIDAMQEVVIEDDVMFAANVIVMDGLHGFAHVTVPYKYQPMWRIAPVVIGRGSWIGQNVVIMPGVRIGEMCIIGANSIVTHDVPARCVAFGNPARVIKRWDERTNGWIPANDAEPRSSDATGSVQ